MPDWNYTYYLERRGHAMTSGINAFVITAPNEQVARQMAKAADDARGSSHTEDWLTSEGATCKHLNGIAAGVVLSSNRVPRGEKVVHAQVPKSESTICNIPITNLPEGDSVLRNIVRRNGQPHLVTCPRCVVPIGVVLGATTTMSDAELDAYSEELRKEGLFRDDESPDVDPTDSTQF